MALETNLLADLGFRQNVALAPFTTLGAGGPAEWFIEARDVDELAKVVSTCHSNDIPVTIIGGGSNTLPSDKGVRGAVIQNATSEIVVEEDGQMVADCGAWLQDVFLKAAQSGLGGLEYSVGIPGSIGGALVSNAGAYRSNISQIVTAVEIVERGRRRWVDPSWMQFSYRDSIFRGPNPPKAVMLRVRLQLKARPAKEIYDEAREYQRQRISKQPPGASAGSFFKNVEDAAFAQTVVGLPDGLRAAGVVPAGYLIDAVGLKGHQLGGASLGTRHANFILNLRGATAWEIWALAQYAKTMVHARFGVTLEEEVLRIGQW